MPLGVLFFLNQNLKEGRHDKTRHFEIGPS